MKNDEEVPIAKFNVGDHVDFMFREELISPDCEIIEVIGPPLYDVKNISYRLLVPGKKLERVEYETNLVLHNTGREAR